MCHRLMPWALDTGAVEVDNYITLLLLTIPEPEMIIGQDLLGLIRVSFRLNALAQLRGTVYL